LRLSATSRLSLIADVRKKENMNINKIIKWTRRAATSAFCDFRWKSRECNPQWVGSPSGGAYVDLSRLCKDSIIYSFGIATEISFDRAIIKETGCNVYGFDPDPRSEAWLNRSETWVPPEFHFSRIALDSTSGHRPFFITDIERMTGGFSPGMDSEQIDADCLTLADIMKRYSNEWVDYIKMDVESAEYPIIESWLNQYDQLPVGQLWIEFHPNGRDRTESTSKSLVKSLSRIGMVPGYRNYFRQPNNYLLINKNIANKRPHPTAH